MRTKTIIITSVLAMLALVSAVSAQTSLTIDRPSQRDISVTWNSDKPAFCTLVHRLTRYHDWELLRDFKIFPNTTIRTTLENVPQIYTEVDIFCGNKEVGVSTNSISKTYGYVEKTVEYVYVEVPGECSKECQYESETCGEGLNCCNGMSCVEQGHYETVCETECIGFMWHGYCIGHYEEVCEDVWNTEGYKCETLA
jgi:hypothetical protein